MTAPISGAFRSRYYVDVPADPGASDPWAHERPAGTFRARDQAVPGMGTNDGDQLGDDLGAPVLPGETYGEHPRTHEASDDHQDLSAPSGFRRSPVNLNTSGSSDDVKHGGQHDPNTPASSPATGAAHGGLRATGVSDAWANPGGMLLGHIYKIVHDIHRQRIPFNRPTLRPIRTTTPAPNMVPEDANNFAASGSRASQPRLRRILRPTGQTDFVDQDAAPATARLVAPSRDLAGGSSWMA